MKKILFTIISTFLFSASITASPPTSFPAAKREAAKIFNNHKETLYCACKYDSLKKVNLKSCNMTSAQDINRARRIEWEHAMPAENFGRHFK